MTAPLPKKSSTAHTVIRARVNQLMNELDCSSYRELGEKLGMDYGYLYRLSKGSMSNPSPRFLEKLGLRRVITYERI